MGRRRRAALVLVVAAVALVSAACTEEPPTATGTTTLDGGTGTGDPDAPVIEQFAGERTSFGPVPDTVVRAEGEPIRVGMINQENVPIGSYPEVRFGALTAADFVNEELGGVDGRPIEIIPCIADFSIEGSQRCAQELIQEDVVAVLGGLDIMSNGSIPVLEQNGVPYVGGIPVNVDEMRSPISFQFSGGSPGAMTAFASHAAETGAERVVVAYADYGPITDAARTYGVELLEDLGVDEVEEVVYPITSTDMVPVLTQAAENDPDAILIFAADAACIRTMETAYDLEVDADIYLVGSCAAPPILAEAGDAAEGVIFSIEGPIGTEDVLVDGPLYAAASERYGPDGFDFQSAGTVSFRAVMNLYAALDALGPDEISSESIVEKFRSARDVPSFDGYPYTCDGEQIPALPSLCSPQQVLVRVRDGELTPESDGWIDVPRVLAERDAGS